MCNPFEPNPTGPDKHTEASGISRFKARKYLQVVAPTAAVATAIATADMPLETERQGCRARPGGIQAEVWQMFAVIYDQLRARGKVEVPRKGLCVGSMGPHKFQKLMPLRHMQIFARESESV